MSLSCSGLPHCPFRYSICALLHIIRTWNMFFGSYVPLTSASGAGRRSISLPVRFRCRRACSPPRTRSIGNPKKGRCSFSPRAEIFIGCGAGKRKSSFRGAIGRLKRKTIQSGCIPYRKCCFKEACGGAGWLLASPTSVRDKLFHARGADGVPTGRKITAKLPPDPSVFGFFGQSIQSHPQTLLRLSIAKSGVFV